MKKNTLNRQLSVVALITYYISTIVGVGIFLVPMHATKIAGPASLLTWVLVLLIIYPFALIFSHISQTYQVSGSIQKFIEDGAGKNFGRGIALFVIITAMFGNFLLGHTGAMYVEELLGLENSLYTLPIALSILFISCLFNLIRLGLSSKIQTFALIVLVLVLSVIVFFSVPSYKPQNLSPFFINGYDSVFAAILVCFYSVVGWDNVDSIAEEVKDPNKNYRKAIRFSLAFIAIFYLSIAFTVIMVIPLESMSGKNTVLSILLNETFGLNASRIGSIIAIVLLFLGANAWILGTSRMIFALARDKVLPAVITRVDKVTRVPYVAVLSQMFFYILLAVFIWFTKVGDGKLVEVASLNYLIMYAVVFYYGVKLFKTTKLKVMSACSLVISLALILYSLNHFLLFSFGMLVICLLYVWAIKNQRA